MKVRVFIGLVDPGLDPVPYGFLIGRRIPMRENCEFPRAPHEVAAGCELDFKVWLEDRGIATECEPDGPFWVEADFPDRLVFEMINAWSAPR